MRFNIVDESDIYDTLSLAFYTFEGKKRRSPEIILMHPEAAANYKRQTDHMELGMVAMFGYLELNYRGVIIRETNQLTINQLELY